MKKLGYLLSCVALLVSGVITVSAQDAVDPASLDYVVKAYANTLASTSLHIESQSQTATQDQQQGTPGFGQKQTASFDASKTTDSWNVNGSRTIAITTQNGEIDVQIDTIIVDGKLYMQISGMPQFGQQQDQTQNAAPTVPQGWFDPAQLDASGQRVPGVGNTDPQTTIQTLLDALNLPVSGQSVTALKELPADNIDGESMRVFQLTLDPAVILQSDAAGLLRGALGGFGGFGGFGPRGQGTDGQNGNGQQGGQNGNGQNGNFTPPGQGTAFPTRQPPNPADYQITFAVYVGDQDQLIHRIYSVIAITATQDNGNGFGGQSARTITTVTDFSKFNEPVTITAPQLASS
jgi:hypothetical protein